MTVAVRSVPHFKPSRRPGDYEVTCANAVFDALRDAGPAGLTTRALIAAVDGWTTTMVQMATRRLIELDLVVVAGGISRLHSGTVMLAPIAHRPRLGQRAMLSAAKQGERDEN